MKFIFSFFLFFCGFFLNFHLCFPFERNKLVLPEDSCFHGKGKTKKIGLNQCKKSIPYWSVLGFHGNTSLRFHLRQMVFSIIQGNFAFADDREFIEKLSVIGRKESLPTQPGSSHLVSKEELKKFEFDDIHQALRKVPSIHIQSEEGFGLRPNIGLRATHPHRSRKITLMEDGVLIAPAPYAAPAAYYFPQLERMDSIEVFKGTPSTLFGPSSIGGALNLVTKINEPGIAMGLTRGLYGFSKYDLSTGFDLIGDMSLDYNRIETTGFKKLKNEDNTGFVRNNFSFRWDNYFEKFNQSLTFKLNWSNEDSNATYTGLARNDFNLNPFHRYSATELDKITWNHRQFFLSHSFDPVIDLHIRSTFYHHRLDRSWFKLNGFFDDKLNLRTLLRNPHISSNNYFYRVLKGEEDSGVLSKNRDVLDLGNNQRQYLSRGVQLNMDYELNTYGLGHLFYFGFRYHEDSVDRFHESSYYNMKSGGLKSHSSLEPTVTILNKSQAKAGTFSFNYRIFFEKLSFNMIARYEDIHYRQKNFLKKEYFLKNKDHLFVPGLGVFYQMFPSFGFLAGINKGFTPRGPGQRDEIQPEEAVNYELGVRYKGFVSFEIISFLTDYKNISGTCTGSRGCQPSRLDQVFNGGRAGVLGLDFLFSKDIRIKHFNIPVDLTTTFTQTEFKNFFQTSFPEWGVGSVFPGDPLPYIPKWRSNFSLGFEWKNFFAYLNLNYRDRMADQSVAFGLDSVNREFIKERFLLSLSLIYRFSRKLTFRFRADNLTNQYYEVSQKPFGLRPGRPRFFLIGAQLDFS